MKREYRNLAEFTNGLSAGQEWAADLLWDLGEVELHAEVGKEGLLWIQAAYEYDHGDPTLLASVLRFSEGKGQAMLPEGVALLLADIVTGDRIPDPKSLSQMKGNPRERWDYLMGVIIYGKGLEVIRHSSVKIADDLVGADPAQVRQLATTVHGAIRAATMQKLGIKERQLDKLLKIFRNNLKNYPKLHR